MSTRCDCCDSDFSCCEKYNNLTPSKDIKLEKIEFIPAFVLPPLEDGEIKTFDLNKIWRIVVSNKEVKVICNEGITDIIALKLTGDNICIYDWWGYG